MNLAQFTQNVNKKLKKNIIRRGNEALEVPRFPSGSFALDVELGGGVAEGRIITLAGMDGDGKTAMSLKMAAGFLQKHPNMRILWIDAEGSFDTVWAKALGVDTDKVQLLQPDYAEQGYQIALEALKTEDCGLIVVDSVAAMTPKSEAEGDMEDMQVAAQARVNRKFLRKSQSYLLDCEKSVVPTIILINQFTTNIGGYGNPDIEGGGKGLRYYPSIKLILKKGELFDGKKTYKTVGANDEGVEVKAQQIKFYVEKNKTAPPKRRGHFWFYFDDLDTLRQKGSIDRLEEVIRYARRYDIIVQRGSAYDLPNPITGEVMTFKGSAAVAEYIRHNEPARKFVEEKVQEKMNTLFEGQEVSNDPEEEDPTTQGDIATEDALLDDRGWEIVDIGDDD